MTKPRSQLIDINQTPYYHCINRCVRRSFLCGEDHLTGNNYDYRKAWLAERLSLLSRIFSIDIASYAIMANHYRVDRDRDSGLALNDEQVAKRWQQKFIKGQYIFQRLYCPQ